MQFYWSFSTEIITFYLSSVSTCYGWCSSLCLIPNLKFPLPSSLLGFLSDLCCSLGILSSTLSHRMIHINSTFSQEQCPLKSQYINLVASKGIPIILLQLSNLFVSLFWPPNSASYLMAALGFFVPNHFVLLLLLIVSSMWA